MSDFQMYHALAGQDQQPTDRRSPSVPPPFSQTPRQPSPLPPSQQASYDGRGYVPGGMGSYPPAAAQAHQGYQYTSQGHFGAQPQGAYAGGMPTDAGVGTLAADMGNLNVNEASAVAFSRGAMRKKHRHAHHNLEPSRPPSFPTSPYAAQTTPAGQPFSAPTQHTPGAGPYNPSVAGAVPHRGIPTPGFETFQASAQGRVDPDHIPSVPSSRDVPAQYFLENIYATMSHHLPPPAAVPFVAYDQGNSSPKFARLSMNNIPSTAEALASTSLPLGLLLQPLAPLQEGELPIPVLDFGEAGPPRCRRCRAYVNPFMSFKEGGNRFVCNMCNFPNEVSTEYFMPLDPQGVRVDRQQRPELMRGTVEFMVPKEYWNKDPVPLRILFVIDVSQEAVNRGFLESFCEGVLAALYGQDESSANNADTDGAQENNARKNLAPGSKVGIMTFDKAVHFYNLHPGAEKAQLMVVPDIDDPFVPLSEGLFVDPYESKDLITTLLTQLPSLFADIKYPEPALLPTLNAALAALSATGGKIVCSLSALPTWGPGRLFLRDDGKVQSVENEKKLFTTDHPDWKKTAEKMAQSGVGVDMFLAAPSGGYLDVATVGHISATTGGEVFYYPNFHSPRDTLKLASEVKHCVTRETGYQALMRVRCSNGLQVSAYHGNFVQHTFGAELELGTIDADKAFGIMFSYDGKLDQNLDAHFQSALLYTTAAGERRVRCCNIVASVSEGSREAMRYVDQDAVVHLIAKEAASRVTERSLKEIRAALTEKTIDILAVYRRNISGSYPPGQLVLPEYLKEFSMYALGLIKSRAFKGGPEPSDRRAHEIRMIKSMGAMELSLYLYPRIFALHSLADEDGFPDEHGHLRMPPCVRASFSRMDEGGAYLVDNGQACLLWLHAQVSPHLLQDLFGDACTSLHALNAATSALPVLPTRLNAQARNILQYLARLRGSKAVALQLARQGLDGAEFEFARLLVEDRNNEAQSYVDWLVHVHRNIQLEVRQH